MQKETHIILSLYKRGFSVATIIELFEPLHTSYGLYVLSVETNKNSIYKVNITIISNSENDTTDYQEIENALQRRIDNLEWFREQKKLVENDKGDLE